MNNRKKKYKKLKRTIGIVICHGKTEYLMIRYIISNLHLKMEKDARDHGEHSIQITSIINFLKSGPYKNRKAFIEKFLSDGSELDDPDNFKVFIVMDTDDCTEKEKQDFISKAMFKKHWLYPYIEPIYNSENIDDVFLKSNINTRKISDDEKGTYYTEIFPINSEPLSLNTIQEIETFRDKLKSADKTSSNLIDLVAYCLDRVEKI